MIRRMCAVVILSSAMGCSAGTAEATGVATPPDAFAGTWRSVTPSLEFVELSVNSLSSQMGVLGLRLTYSGVAFEGTGRIDSDSLVADMTVAGTSQSTGTVVAHARDAHTLQLQVRSSTATPLNLTLVRQE